MAAPTVTAAILVIGDEILSGRTKDKNIGYIAEYLTGLGIDLREVRVVPDVADEIVAASTPCAPATPTSSPPAASGRPMTTSRPTASPGRSGCRSSRRAGGRHDARALQARGSERGAAAHGAHPARRGPHRQPDFARPGFRLENVIVMAGVPSIMQAMLDNVAGTLETGTRMTIETIDAGGLPEGLYAAGLGAVAQDHGGVSIGSYPSFGPNGFRNQIVVRGKDAPAVAAATRACHGTARRPQGRANGVDRHGRDRGCPLRRKKPFRSRGTSSTATPARSPGGSPARARSRRSSASPAAGSCRRPVVSRELGTRLIETVCIASYHDYKAQGDLAVLKDVAPSIKRIGDGAGKGVLVVDDLTDTERPPRWCGPCCPTRTFATVYAKPAGRR
jgi:adenine/guanine phosphoribosyltransferase-like PRPP-binding protein